MTECGPQSYATIEDFQTAGLPPSATSGVSFDVIQKALQRASDLASSYLRDRYNLPLRCGSSRACGYDGSLVEAVVDVAAWYVMKRRGFDPRLGADTVIRQGYDDALEFLKRVANGQSQLRVCESPVPSQQPQVSSNVPRGYGAFGELNAANLPVAGGRAGGWGT